MILGIYGAGGLGREVYELSQAINEKENRWSEIIFIDDANDLYNPRDLKIINFESLMSYKHSDIEICIAIGEPSIREKLYTKIIKTDFSLATLIHPEVSIPASTIIEDGAIVCKFVSITCDIKIGKNVYIHPMACIGHDSIVGDHSIISSYVDVAGDCHIGNRTFLAIGVIMKQGIIIGDDSIIGLGSVVHRDIQSSVIALGNPARPMKNNIEKKVFK